MYQPAFILIVLTIKSLGMSTPQATAAPQRHRSLGNDAEVRRVESVPAQVVTPL